MNFKRGQRVKIVSIKHTDKRFGTNGRMLDEINTFQKIEIMDGRTCAKINGCYWSTKDLRPIMKPKESQIVYFDEALLEG